MVKLVACKKQTMFKNPIDKDKTAEDPGLIPYPHTIGSIIVKPEDEGKLKSRALSAMREQTNKQLAQIQKQAALLQNKLKIFKNVLRSAKKYIRQSFRSSLLLVTFITFTKKRKGIGFI